MQEEGTAAAGAGRMVRETRERWHQMEGTGSSTAWSSISHSHNAPGEKNLHVSTSTPFKKSTEKNVTLM